MPSNSFWDHPIDKIEEALSIRKQMAALQQKLSSLFGSDDEPATTGASSTGKGKRGGRRKMSPETIAKMRASQQARWANKVTSGATATAAGTPAKRGKRGMSAAGRARIAAAQKARWAKVKGTSTASVEALATNAKKKKRKLSPEGRARIVAALKARHAAKKAAAK